MVSAMKTTDKPSALTPRERVLVDTLTDGFLARLAEVERQLVERVDGALTGLASLQSRIDDIEAKSSAPPTGKPRLRLRRAGHDDAGVSQ
jgi:hypothetical protein